jgi:SAM-dependent methyltransferase
VTDRFYLDILRRLVADGVVATSDRLLVACGGQVDRDTLVAAGFTDVVITNLDERMDVYNEYAPFEWRHEDAEALTAADDSVDWGVVHHGLHHCASPHRALAELLRVGRKGAIAFEARDSLVVRAGVRLGLVEEYEVTAVAANEGRWGGVRNGPIPNHVYRWTEREVRKTVQSLLPSHQHDIRFAYGLRLPADRLGQRSRMLHAAQAVAPVVERVAPRQGNEFAFIVTKNIRPQPWLREG